MTTEHIDLFEHIDTLPKAVRDIVLAYSREDEGIGYQECQELEQALKSHSYIFDWGLDGTPYNLRKVGGGRLGSKLDFDFLPTDISKWFLAETLKTKGASDVDKVYITLINLVGHKLRKSDFINSMSLYFDEKDDEAFLSEAWDKFCNIAADRQLHKGEYFQLVTLSLTVLGTDNFNVPVLIETTEKPLSKTQIEYVLIKYGVVDCCDSVNELGEDYWTNTDSVISFSTDEQLIKKADAPVSLVGSSNVFYA